jgi:hypothetical protein
VLVLILVLLLAAPANAQHEHHPATAASGWSWSADSSVFLTGNFQVREFRDFYQFESQNWFMGMATRRLGPGSFGLRGMVSLEPFTLRDLGSAQVFQTGETFAGAPLIDYQHPHDLIMELSASYERPTQRGLLLFHGGLVDAPALGPTPYMHRASAALQPTTPLSHHQLDSTHITHGGVTAGGSIGSWQLETSVFQGRESDEDRIGLDLGPLDSISVRGSWIRRGTRAQVSVGFLNDPHVSEPGDITRLTASVEHEGELAGRAVAFTAAWGQNRGQFSNEDAVLGEAVVGLSARGKGYLRGELVEKHILAAGGPHPPGFQHPHLLSLISALTLGYQHSIVSMASAGTVWTLSLGADVTGYVTPANLAVAYGRPLSFHIYGRLLLRYPERPLQEGR